MCFFAIESCGQNTTWHFQDNQEISLHIVMIRLSARGAYLLSVHQRRALIQDRALISFLICFDVNGFFKVSLTSINKSILDRYLRRPIRWSCRNNPCRVKRSVLIRMAIRMGALIGMGALINKITHSKGARVIRKGALIGRRALNRIITVCT